MVGRTVGHYRIVRKIGEGGVGQVYLADDLTLDRQVALKVLAESSAGAEQAARFEREAKAAAALDHPNILTIHEFGRDGDMPYVVMELLDGRTLRQVLEDGPLSSTVAVRHALQIVSGLAAAHERGIWHRDLKPENVFVTRDGRVKILDFGLASLRGVDRVVTESDESGATRRMLTRPGVVLGTIGYMAPEQVRGEAVDGRADLFAVGAVLYEMLAGRRAFAEPTPVETLHAILKSAPSLDVLEKGGVPAAVIHVVGRCLEKTREERFQNAGEIAAALEAAASTSQADRATSPARRLDSWKEIASYLGRGVRTVQRWEREEQLPVHRLEHSKRGSVYALESELARWWSSRQSAPPPTAPTPPAPGAPVVASGPPIGLPKLARLTNTLTLTFSPALSSDARMLAYVSSGDRDDSAPQLWVQQVGGAAMRLTSGMDDVAEAAFSADDTSILFTANGDSTPNVYAVPTMGGQPRIVKRQARFARVSPDGKWLAYLSLESPRGIRLERIDDASTRTIGTDLMDIRSVGWSADSDRVLVRAHPDSRFEPDFWVVPVDGGASSNTGIMERFRPRGAVLDSPPVWVRDGVIFMGAGRDGVLLWRHALAPDTFEAIDDPQALTRGTEWAAYPTAAAGRLAFVSAQGDMNLWSLPLDEANGRAAGAPRRLTRGPGILGHIDLAADGKRLTYFSTRLGGFPNLFLRDLETGSDAPVAGGFPTVRAFPTISPTTDQLAYGTLSLGPRSTRPLFVMDLATGTPRQLCDDCGARPRLWLDDATILAETFGVRLSAFLAVDAASGAQRPLLASEERSVSNPRVSPDGRWVAFDAAVPGGPGSVFIAPLRHDAPIAESEWIVIADGASHPFWSRDGGMVCYLPTTPSRDLRRTVHARRTRETSGQPKGDVTVVATLAESLIPTILPGTAPIAVRGALICVLADFRGDVWMMDI